MPLFPRAPRFPLYPVFSRYVLTSLFAFSLSAAFAQPALAGVNVVATTQDLASLTEAVGGSNVTVSYIARGDLDPHFIDAKPSYMVKLSTANLLIAVGLDLEVGWLPSLVTGSRNPKIVAGSLGYLDASTAIKPIEVPSGSIDRSQGDLHPGGNPHYWMNPENGRKVARLIEQRLEALDSAHAADYKANLARFEATLTSKEAQWTAALAPLRGSAVIGYHPTFDYFADAYGLKVVGFVEPKPGIPPTPKHSLELAGIARAEGVKYVFVEPYHNPEDARSIASNSGAKVLSMPTSVGGMTGVNTYTDLFDTLVRLITTGK